MDPEDGSDPRGHGDGKRIQRCEDIGENELEDATRTVGFRESRFGGKDQVELEARRGGEEVVDASGEGAVGGAEEAERREEDEDEGGEERVKGDGKGEEGR